MDPRRLHLHVYLQGRQGVTDSTYGAVLMLAFWYIRMMHLGSISCPHQGAREGHPLWASGLTQTVQEASQMAGIMMENVGH